MNRPQFWILIAGSTLLVLALLLQVICARSAQYAQGRALAASQFVNQGRAADTQLQQLAMRIYQVGNQNNDQALKDLLTRQRIIINNPTNATSAAAPEATSTER